MELVTVGELARRVGINRAPMYEYLVRNKDKLKEKGILIEVKSPGKTYHVVDYEKYVEYLKQVDKYKSLMKQKAGAGEPNSPEENSGGGNINELRI